MTSQQWMKTAGYLILVLCCLVLILRGAYHTETSNQASGDFQTIYSMTRCMFDHCDPYDGDQLRQAFVRSGGVVQDPFPFRKHEALYFPSAMTLTIPFALLPYGPAHYLWLLVITASFLTAVFLFAGICSPLSPLLSLCCFGLLVLSSIPLILGGQPAMLTIGLGGIAVWCFLKKKAEWVGVCCMAVSLGYKPHVIGLVWLYFLLQPGTYRKRALQVLALTLAIYIPSMLWAGWMPQSSHWIEGLRSNIAGTTGPGTVVDPGLKNPQLSGASSLPNLQSLFALIRDDARFYNLSSYLSVAMLFAVWLYPVLRMQPGREKDYFALASVACITLMPTYHLDHDTRILLLSFPALAYTLAAASPDIRAVVFSINFAVLLVIARKTQTYLFAHIIQPMMPLGPWGILFWLRQVPLCVLGLGVFYLVLFHRALAQKKSGLEVSARKAAA